MPHIKKIRVSGKEYFVLAHNVRFGAKTKTLTRYLGKNLPPKHKLEKIKAKFESEIKILEEPVILNPEQKKILEKIKSNYLSHLKKLGKGDVEKLDEFIATNFTYNTNAIEGSTLSLADVQSVFKGSVPEGKDLRELYGAENMRKAYNYIKSIKTLSEKRILEMHKIAMQDILPIELGRYRTVQVYVGDHIPPTPIKVKELMGELVRWYNMAKRKLHSFELACIMHAKFEDIHPFRDGNGRVGRLIMNYILLSNGYPLLDIKFERRAEYYKALQEVNGFKQFVDYAFSTYIKMAKDRRWL